MAPKKKSKSKMVKLTVYIGYDAEGIAKSNAIRAYAKSLGFNLSELILNSLQLAHPDLKL